MNITIWTMGNKAGSYIMSQTRPYIQGHQVEKIAGNFSTEVEALFYGVYVKRRFNAMAGASVRRAVED